MINERTGLPAAGTLYVVATPIGNLSDLSPRACDTLKNVDLIAAEDTRHTGILLKHFQIGTPQLSLHDHNEGARAVEIIARLREGKSVALVSDAGTPAISDPGFELVRAVAAAGINIIAARKLRLKSLEREARTLVIYESPHRVRETLEDCVAAFGAARAAAAVREATKLHETTYRGSLQALLEKSRTDADFSRGEIVLLIGGAAQAQSAEEDSEAKAQLDKVLIALLAELPLKQAARLAAQITGARDNEAYKRALFLKQQSASH